MRQRDSGRALRPGVYLRAVGTAGLGLLFLGLLAARLQALDPGQVLAALGAVGVGPWLGATLATWIAFRAVAGYDRALHCHLATGIDPVRAGRAGGAAIAIAQTVGMGVLSGALVRWRMLLELGLWGATRLSALVAVSFLLAWGVLTALVLCLVPDAPGAALAPWVLAGAGLALGLVLAAPAPWCPNLNILSRLLALAAIDCLAAGFALWLMLPVELAFSTFFPVFLLALGAGLVSGSPAGLGAFEITLLALLPGVDETGLIAGVLAWRILAYALPAMIGAGVALAAGDAPAPATRPAALAGPAIAEAGLVAQGLLWRHPAGFVAGRTRHGLVALAAVADPARFQAAAQAEGRWPVLYKAGARQAAKARRAGLVVLPMAREAWLDPQTFRLDLPARATLRRKLRRAAASGVAAAPDICPDWVALATVNAAWVAARGGERGFSMGRFDPDYLAGQRVIVARLGARVAGFASFHRACVDGRRVWTLDLLRPDPAAPEGTAQLLVIAALDAARAEGAARLSLAAVPMGPDGDATTLVARLGRLLPEARGGLAQFKSGFAPRWERLYIAGPSLAALALVGFEIWRAVCRPPVLAKLSRSAASDADYEIASCGNPWQREDKQTL